MHYTIKHVTRFRYSTPVSESVMEVRKQPLSETNQRLLRFILTTQPRSQVMSYMDHLHNTVHHFNIPGQHAQLTITAEALVQVTDLLALPAVLAPEAWGELDAAVQGGEYYDFLLPSRFAVPSPALDELIHTLDFKRGRDPLTTIRNLNTAIYMSFAYAPNTTSVHSPIDDALQQRRGVCQDFAHIMITMARSIGVPARYVSGYLVHRLQRPDRSQADATHAWIEVFLPGHGWVGFDPTNNLLAGRRHIRVAAGRDYDDVPPTRGVYRGKVSSELSVAVEVRPSEAPIEPAASALVVSGWRAAEVDSSGDGAQEQQEQQ